MRAPAIKSVLLFAAAAFLGYIAGINTGYTQGFNAAVNSGSADAAVFASVLASLDSENSDQVRKLLEGHLDSLLIDNTIGRSISPFVLHRWIFSSSQNSIDGLAAHGARYRLENPYRGGNQEVQDLVEDAARAILEREKSLHKE
jgi:hypothetical protein